MKKWLDFSELSFLGEANHGLYFRAWPPPRMGLAQSVALKVLVPQSSDHQWHCVAREIRLLDKISSPYVVDMLDYGHHQGRLYFVMEYAAMGTLARPSRRLTRFERLNALAHGTRGLQVLHDLGVVHRDVKPAKILVYEGGGKLNDLGIAEDNFVTQRAVPTGSIGFMAPEVARGGAATVQSDIYSIGATLYLMLTGQGIFPRVPLHDLEAALSHVAESSPLIEDSSRFPKLLELARHCLERDPQKRPESAARVATRLEESLQSECTSDVETSDSDIT